MKPHYLLLVATVGAVVLFARPHGCLRAGALASLLLMAVGCSSFVVESRPGTIAPRRPNVIFFLSDDLGYGDLAGHGNPHTRTPNLDRFARDGVEFTHFFVSPICHPTRAALMTGRYAQRTFREVSYHMSPEEVTVAEILRGAGYKTGMFGKWHLGDEPEECPNAQGFDEVVTFNKGMLPANSYFDPELLHNGKPQKYHGYCMDVFTDEAITFIRQNKDRPFFVYLPANLIHEPLVVPRDLEAKYKQLGGDLPPLYGMIESMDTNFGRLRTALKELGLEDNTLLIFSSDNGPQIRTRPEVERTAGFHGLKGTVYNGGIRTMCFARWPAGFAGRRKVEQYGAHIDMLPTILEACGVAVPAGLKIDGRSLMPLLRDPSAAWLPRTLVIQCDSNGPPTREWAYTLITVKWKLVQAVGCEMLRGMHEQYADLCDWEGRGRRSIAGNVPRFELYDIRNDPGETRDLALQHPEVVEELRKQYNAWFEDISATARWRDVGPNKEADAHGDGEEPPPMSASELARKT